MRIFYVYAHKISQYENFVYIGKGTGKRAWSKRNRNYLWNRFVSDSFKVEILFESYDETEAIDMEIQLISKHKPPFNLTKGGHGGNTHNHLPKGQVSNKVRKLKLEYWKNPKPGHREKCAQAARNASKKFWSSLSTEQIFREQRRRSLLRVRKPVLCLNNGIVYESSKKACEALGLKSADVVGKVASGRKKSYKNYKFKYYKIENISK